MRARPSFVFSMWLWAAGLVSCSPEPAPATSSQEPPVPDAALVPSVEGSKASEGAGSPSSQAPLAEPSDRGDAGAPDDAGSAENTLTLIAGGDVSFGRMIGQMLIRDPNKDFFTSIQPLLRGADIRFCNLESQLSDQGGQTVSPLNNLVFTGPPQGADALARAGFTLVSTANNHAWDYGKKALFETMDHLKRVNVRYVGTGRDRDEAYAPVLLSHAGLKLAMLAVTDIWNQGTLWTHPAKDYVAGADKFAIASAVRALREDQSIDFIVVSYHGLAEYMNEPLQRTKDFAQAVIDAGADLVIGHHPHVVNGISWYRGKPILYSLGNLLMRMSNKSAWTEMGYLARLRFSRGPTISVEACPFRMFGTELLRFVGDPLRKSLEQKFFMHLTSISKGLGGITLGAIAEDGCATVSPAAPLNKAPKP